MDARTGFRRQADDELKALSLGELVDRFCRLAKGLLRVVDELQKRKALEVVKPYFASLFGDAQKT